MIYIRAIHMNGYGDTHQHIAAVRWRNPDGDDMGEITRAGMVEWIRDKQGDARVSDGTSEVRVGVVDGSPPYIRTYADGRWTNNLLSLPRV